MNKNKNFLGIKLSAEIGDLLVAEGWTPPGRTPRKMRALVCEGCNPHYLIYVPMHTEHPVICSEHGELKKPPWER